MYIASQNKTPIESFCDNFGKYGPILILFSPLHSAMNSVPLNIGQKRIFWQLQNEHGQGHVIKFVNYHPLIISAPLNKAFTFCTELKTEVYNKLYAQDGPLKGIVKVT